jgi:hypothetical protein
LTVINETLFKQYVLAKKNFGQLLNINKELMVEKEALERKVHGLNSENIQIQQDHKQRHRSLEEMLENLGLEKEKVMLTYNEQLNLKETEISTIKDEKNRYVKSTQVTPQFLSLTI